MTDIDKDPRTLLRRLRHFIPLMIVALAVAGCGLRQPPFREIPLQELRPLAEAGLERPTGIRGRDGRMTVEIFDAKGGSDRHRLDLTLRYKAARNLYLTGNFLGKSQVRIGSNEERYWLLVVPEGKKLWWGYWSDVEKAEADDDLVPAKRLLEALGQVNLDPPAGADGPWPQRREQRYALLYTARDKLGRGYIAKEIFLTASDPVLVSRIVYYDPDGKIEMEIKLDDYRYIKDEGAGAGYLARTIELNWPGLTQMKLKLGRVKSIDIGMAAFEFPAPDEYDQQEQIGVCDGEQ